MRVEAAADDEFVTVELDHRLDGDAQEVFLAGAFGDGGFDGLPGAADGGGVAQVELHAADVGLVGDGFRVELQHDRVADFVGQLDRASSSVLAMRVSTVGMP